MREIIITDLTRFAPEDPKVCIAAIDIKTGECLRPIPYMTSDRAEKLTIHPGAIFRGNLDFSHNTNPHIEDSGYTELSYHGACSGEQFQEVLNNSLSNSVSEGFGYPFGDGEKVIPHDQHTNCSIITLKLEPSQLSIHENRFKPGGIRATFTDNSDHRYAYLSITDRGFYDYAMNHQNDGKLNEVTDFIDTQKEVYLRIGLSRVYKVSDGRNGFWLQVNGIYTFPDFHQSIRSYEQ